MDFYGINLEQMRLLITDAAKYMILAGKKLKIDYRNFFHVTCFIHLMHNCALNVKYFFTDLDFLIASLKMAVLKSTERKNMFTNIPIPPSPLKHVGIVSCWQLNIIITNYQM